MFALAVVMPLITSWQAAPLGATVTDAHVFGGSVGYDAVEAIVVDGWGNYYLAGHLYDTDDDGLIEKHSSSGTLLWQRMIETGSSDMVNDVVVDSGGAAYVAGFTSGDLAGTAGEDDAFLRKYSDTGNVLWTWQFGTVADDGAAGVAVSGDGAVYVVGWTTGSLGGVAAGGYDGFIRKYSSAGSVEWTRQFGTSANLEGANDVAVDGLGNAYVIGDLDGAPTLRKYAADGTMLFEQLGSAGTGDGVAVDGSGGVYAVGTTDEDAFVWKYDTSGTEQWTKQFGTTDEDIASAVSVDATAVYVAGATWGELVPVAEDSYGHDAFVRTFAPSTGAVRWTQQFGTDDYYSWIEARAVAPAGGGDAWVGGHTTGPVFGSADPANIGAFDAKVVEDDPVAPTVTSDPVDEYVRAGATASFDAVAVADPTPGAVQWETSVQWQVRAASAIDWTDVTGATSPELSFTAEASMDGNQYRAVFSTADGAAQSEPATLLVATNEITITAATVSKGYVMVSFTTSGTPTLTVFQCDLGSRREPWVSCSSGQPVKAHGKLVRVRGISASTIPWDSEQVVVSAEHPIVRGR